MAAAKSMDLTGMQRIGLEALWLFARAVAVLPYWFKYYVLEDLLFFVVCYLLRYRRKVVLTNLRNAFPEKTPAEIGRICRKFYRTLAEMVINTINMAHMPPAKARKAIRVGNLEEHHAAVHGRNWIGLLAHFGCWEFGSYWGLYEPSQLLVAVYHPLRSKVFDAFYHRLRNHANSMTVPMKETMRFYLRHCQEGIDGKTIVLGLIADQSPHLRPDSHWFRFLNQDTVFFDGGEKLALRCRVPVFFVRMERLQRGRYRMWFEPIYDGEEPVAPNEITERYVRKLEAMIRERPDLWMWSHRRWKIKRPDGC